MNLAEFPLSAVADRFLDGRKTVVFSDQVWDRVQGKLLPRELAISGSDRYGLPTARDEDVLLACVQLSSREDFQSREVEFTRYELLKMLRWPDETKHYERLATSLRRWKGVTIYSNRAFFDHAHDSWVNRDFGVFDNLYLYEREFGSASRHPARSRLVWNEVLWRSFQAGYLKRIDWDLYCRLSNPVAKRLYRLLDKRFYHGDEVCFDLRTLAHRKIRLSENYNVAQIKRVLAAGIEELESKWELRSLSTEKRFVKRAPGQWEVVFSRKRFGKKMAAEQVKAEVHQAGLAQTLCQRGIGPATAEELIALASSETVRTMSKLYDWYEAQGRAKGPGFLVDSIRHPQKYRFPPGFRAENPKPQRHSALQPQKRPERNILQSGRSPATKQNETRLAEFSAFWEPLSEEEQIAFESEALRTASSTKRAGYFRTQGMSGEAFEQYRQLILCDHFERQRSSS